MLDAVTSLARWRELLSTRRREGRSVGLVMTMGALHRGHVALFERAASECDDACASVFVNPLQFGDEADLARYPRDLDADLAVCDAAGVRLVLAPSVREMWPAWPGPTPTTVHVASLSATFEGADRPGHFDGVAMVVVKVLIATGACRAYFGEKDFQQLVIVRRLVEDLALPVDVVGCETVREDDGLALSSRNAQLSEHGRRSATSLARALAAGRLAIERGLSIDAAIAAMRAEIATEHDVTLAYAAVVEPATLLAPSHLVAGTEVRVLIAAIIDGVRLIDNVAALCGAAA